MNYKDTIKQMMFNYPSIFPNPLKAAIQLFFTVGNGYFWNKNGQLVSGYSNKMSPVMLYDDLDERLTWGRTDIDIDRIQYNLEIELARTKRKFIEDNIDGLLSGNHYMTDFEDNYLYYNNCVTHIGQYHKLIDFPDNIAKDWGNGILEAMEWALYNLNKIYGVSYKCTGDVGEWWPEHARQSYYIILEVRERLRKILGQPSKEEREEFSSRMINEILSEENKKVLDKKL